jgi:DNA-binding response OmpR family regulator
VLADNSYTIRRIVELSFSEEEEIELVSFENSVNLREKLMELKPAIVLVDIKLPEFNGYDVCRFINSTENLKHTHVFLLKGGFEPVDENLLKGLRFVDIITKPFDSNALVSTIKNILQQPPAATSALEEFPTSIPEDLPEVGGIHGGTGEEISFSDIKQEIDADDIMVEAAGRSGVPSSGMGMGGGSYPDEEVLPSEEITQGAQPDRDLLAPAMESPEDLDNPFQDDIPGAGDGMGTLTEEELNIKRNIAQQEKELEIGSLTQEELDIKKQIGDREKDLFREHVGADDIDVSDEEFSEMMRPPDIGISSPEADSFGIGQPAEDEDDIPSVYEEMPMAPTQPQISEIPDLQASEIEKEMGLEPDLETSPTTRRIEMPSLDTEPQVDEIPDISSINIDDTEPPYEPPIADYKPPSPFDEDAASMEDIPSFDQVEEPSMETPQVEIPPVELPSIMDELEPGEPEPEPVVEIPPMEASPVYEEPETPDFDVPKFESELEPEPPVMEYEVPAAPPTFTETPAEEPVEFERQPTAPEEVFDSFNVETEPEPPVMEYEVPPTPTAPEIPVEPRPVKPPIEPEPPVPPVREIPREPEPVEPSAARMPAIDNEEILKRVEDRLIVAIKEILWEIVPPLAEKIITEEIETIKAEVSQSFK